jgi:SAM-dependent methyltransferase
MTNQCLACHGERLGHWFEKKAAHGEYSLWKCRHCGSAFVLPRPSQEALDDFYAAEGYRGDGEMSSSERMQRLLESENSYPNSSLDAARTVNCCRGMARGNRFLDIGAGFGFFSKEAARRGFQVTALEPAPSCRQVFALLNGFEALPRSVTAPFVEENKGSFDVVFMSQVLEHLRDPDLVVGWLYDLLAPDGLAALAVPRFASAVSRLQGRKDMFVDPPEHLNFFTPGGLQALFERHGFECLGWETVSRFDPERIRRRVPSRAMARLASAALKAGLALSDRMRLGMYLNAYFRKR